MAEKCNELINIVLCDRVYNLHSVAQDEFCSGANFFFVRIHWKESIMATWNDLLIRHTQADNGTYPRPENWTAVDIWMNGTGKLPSHARFGQDDFS